METHKSKFIAVINNISYVACIITSIPLSYLTGSPVYPFIKGKGYKELYFIVQDPENHSPVTKNTHIFRIHRDYFEDKLEWVIDSKYDQPSRHFFTKSEKAQSRIVVGREFVFENFVTERVLEIVVVTDQVFDGGGNSEESQTVKGYFDPIPV